ncbi:hypothetical protein [Exiguobacterium sp. R-17]
MKISTHVAGKLKWIQIEQRYEGMLMSLRNDEVLICFDVPSPYL